MNTEQRLRKILVENFGIEEHLIHSNARLIIDMDIDSLDRVELLMDIEEVFDLNIDDADFRKLDTFADVVRLVDAKKQGAWVGGAIA